MKSTAGVWLPFVLLGLALALRAPTRPARPHGVGAQAHLRRKFRQERERSRALAGNTTELRRALRLQLQQFPVPDAVVTAAKAAMGGFKSVTAKSVEESTAMINKLLQDAQLELDEVETECRGLPEQIQQEAADASSEVLNTAAQLGSERSIVENAAMRIPAAGEWFANFAYSAKLAHKDCALEQAETQAHDFAFQHSFSRMASIKTTVTSKCGSSLLLDVQHCPEEADKGEEAVSLAQLPSWSHHLLPSTRQRLGPLLLQIDSLAATSTSQNPACKIVQQSCEEMMGGVEEILGELKDGRAMLQVWGAQRMQDCDVEERLEEAELRRTAHRRQDLSMKLAKATGAADLLSRQEELQDAHRLELDKQLDEARQGCQDKINHLVHGQICGLRNVRDQMMLLLGKKELPEDCEVTDWEDGPCSVSCGRGVRTSTRQVMSPAYNGGMACPPLQMRRACGDTASCPKNCVVSQWSGWSACSADCDTGVEQRTRNALEQAANGGDSCPNLVEVRECNTQACDQDCALAEWSDWGLCSRACDGGHQNRLRPVIRPAVGSGRCWKEDDEERMLTRECNTGACSNETSMKCGGHLPLDVVIAVQAGSLSSANFDKVKDLCKEVVKHFAPNSTGHHVGIMAFSDTTTPVPNLFPEEAALMSQIGSNLVAKQGANMVSRGLTAASWALHNFGRPHATSTVVLVLTSRPTDLFLAQQAAAQLHERGGRLIIVAAAAAGTSIRNVETGEKPLPLVSQLATAPAKENMIVVEKVEELSTKAAEIALKVAQSACSDLRS